MSMKYSFREKGSLFDFTIPVLALAILYFVTGELSFNLLSADSIVNIGLFIPEGIALAFVLSFGKKIIPGIFLGQFFLALNNDTLFFVALEVAIINSLEALLALYLFKKFHLNHRLRTLRDIVGLVLVVVFVLQPFSAFFSNMMMYFHGITLWGNLFFSMFSWWFGNVLSQLLFTPFLLFLFGNYKQIDFKDYLLYGVFSGLFITLFLIGVEVTNPFLLMSFTIPLVVFAVMYKNLMYGTWISVVVSISASFCVYQNVGLFHSDSLVDNTINYNLFVLMHIFIVLTVGILFEERKRYENNLQSIIEEEITKNKEQQLLMLQQSRLAQMGEMIAMIAHQWRQPLNNLSLINQILISKYQKKKLDDKVVEYFKENSKKQIDLMSTTIDDFRNFFKMEKEPIAFCINDVIENILEMTKAIYTSHGIKIEFIPEATFCSVGFPNSLAQAILNIINNAKDALEDAKIDEKQIFVDLSANDGNVIIHIRDNAGGIPEDIIHRIFDPYFSTKKDKDGTGLGLYMSKMIIEDQMDAKISVKNEAQGAYFKIIIKGKSCDK